MTLHPGQFTQIGSPKENVVEASVTELNCEFFLSVFQNGFRSICRPLFLVAINGHGKRQCYNYPHGCTQFNHNWISC
jgi:hypothetical protein